MTLYRALVNIPAVSGIPRDAVVNTWSFDVQGPITGVSASIESNLKAFYDAWANYRGALHAWTSATIRYYDLSAPKPRVPIGLTNLALSSAVQTTTLPTECALCFSFQGTPISGQKQARRRGRVFLGTLATVAQSSSSGRPAAALITAVVNAGSALKAGDTGNINWTWVVVSDVGGEASASAQVVGGWVDDAFDTQRRRGLAPSARTIWS